MKNPKQALGGFKRVRDAALLVKSHTVLDGLKDKVRGISLHDGRLSGQIVLNFSKQRGVPLYEYRYACENHEGKHQWSELMITSSTRNNLISSLQPVRPYYLQVRALNGYGRSEWSDTIPYVVR